MGFAEALSAPESVWSLIDYGIAVIVFSRRDAKTPLRRCRGIKVAEVCPPEIDFRQTIAELTDVIHQFDPKILLPLDDRSIWLCSRIATASGIKNAGPAQGQAEFALDKRLQIEAASRAGLRIIPTVNIRNSEDLRHITTFPVFLKPATAVIECGLKLISGPHYTCANQSELIEVACRWNNSYPMLAQPIIPGIGEGVFGLATDSGVKAWSAHRRIRMMNPRGSGSSACQSKKIDDQPLDLLEQMLEETKWRGIFMIEMIRDRLDQLWFMEMNGRPWGSMALARRRGYEYPLWSILYGLDEHFQPDVPTADKDIVCRHLGREIIHLLTVLRGTQSSVVSSWPSRARTILDVLQIKRNHSFYNLHDGESSLFIEDTYRTVFDTLKRKLTSR
jgi:hypothetical protein